MKSIEIMHKFFGSGHPSDKCGDCKNLIKDGNYYKCRIYGNTSSEASDWRKKRNACAMFNVPYNGMLHTIKFVMVLRLHPPHIDVFIGNPTPVTKDEAIASVTEEIADVNVCMVKVMMELNISAGDVVDTMRWKAMRARERMEGSDVSHCE